MDVFVYLVAAAWKCEYSTFKFVQYSNDKLFVSQAETAAFDCDVQSAKLVLSLLSSSTIKYSSALLFDC